MNAIESYPESGIIHLAVNPREDHGGLRRAAQHIRWLPGVVAVADGNGDLEITFHGPADDLLRRIHEALAANR
ncbi:MAG: hypothetical protein FJ395_18830 [Verrucomicrobia bacterium]|nr:hypothetical protein [Verrucomicrobiota bacterium]